jgi:hypothetical protein
MEIRLDPKTERRLAGVDRCVAVWSPEHCLEVATVARRFAPAMERERQREILETIACRLEHRAAAKESAAHGS